MRLVYPLDHVHAGAPEDVAALVGGKAANLGVMARDLGMPVPPGFVITTEACRQVLLGDWPADLDREIRDELTRVEARVGRRFGDPADPLLLSVRSGAPVSMPGMMDTVLDVGVTSATVGGLEAVGGEAFAADCRRRLGSMYRNVIAGGEPPDDPWLQLSHAIEAVFRSWNSDRARAYRAREGIGADMGTAVTVQAMVFGNRDERSATGVLFTRNPATGEPRPYGDVVFAAQGEDVVAGTHPTEPISALDERLPEVAAELRSHAARLEHHYADLCDIEFTIESGRLWLLQVRIGKRSPQAALRIAVDMADDPEFPLSREAAVRRVASLLDPPPALGSRSSTGPTPLTTGLPASPGIAAGEIALSAAAAVAAGDAGRPVVLVRAETSPDDVHGMARAGGILTSTGGIASHAAVVARGWAIPAVVGAAAIRVGAAGIEVDGRFLAAGATITIDGGTGEVFEGKVDALTVPLPAARTLLEWARELGIPIAAAGARQEIAEGRAADGNPVVAAPAAAPPSPDGCLHAIGVKGFATLEGVATALGATPEATRALVDALTAEGLVISSGGAFRLTDAGIARHRRLVAEERASIGEGRAGRWLDGFLDLDRRTKDAITAWQVREARPGAEPILNDHTDAAYDARVLALIGAIAADADAWLGGPGAAFPRFATYRARLAAAAAAVAAGDHRFVASPRVDSLHGVWFELHEDLILLAGRTRAEEVAAGRA